MAADYHYIRWFDQLAIRDIPVVGGKCALLGEMYRQLCGAGILVANGFAVTAEAYRYLFDKGVSGQAVQAMNLMFGLAENIGLQTVALYPFPETD